MARYVAQVTGTFDINIIFTEYAGVTVNVGEGGSVAVGDIVVGPGTSEVFQVPVGSVFAFDVNPLPNFRAAVTANGQELQPDA